ncbi:MAG: pyrimidine 5'-nucleotidase [Betaproteobacteria bacterium]|nr:pyrimidine 5'-nucleotidase [Betaproteobacteria bacterium]MDE2124195.1 pyrimidine 5'-nucleotidase [Betaproteobacteria bacterium]MDE2186936.1 pyrimidine 5'-nucleotidase [Betaproteobacteria bacterium]MDE2324023.1 pyrimidine 5'-nucleotidase [Betaproteobacteria bacterium]
MRRDAGHAPAWLFDMDNTLHDASWRVFPRMNVEMTAYIQRHLGVDPAEANRMRSHFWRRYGATLLGLMHEHGVKAAHFLVETHRFPELPRMLRADPSQRAAIARLPGRKWVLTNAPRDYALRVLRQLKLLKLFEGVISIEDMRQFGRLRPKPDARMLRHVLRRHHLRPAQCVLVEDTLQHLKSAQRLGLRGAWFTRYEHRGLRRQPHAAARPRTCCGRPSYVRAKIASLWRLRSLIPR